MIRTTFQFFSKVSRVEKNQLESFYFSSNFERVSGLTLACLCLIYAVKNSCKSINFVFGVFRVILGIMNAKISAKNVKYFVSFFTICFFFVSLVIFSIKSCFPMGLYYYDFRICLSSSFLSRCFFYHTTRKKDTNLKKKTIF